jgi:hypothetical protein
MAKFRTCPHCKKEHSVNEYLKKVFMVFIWSSWTCESCNRKIRFSLPWRIVSAVCQVLLLYFIFMLRDHVVHVWYNNLFLILLLILGLFLLSFLNRFKMIEE